MPQIDDAELFGNAEDQRAYEDFCANQEAVEKFTLDKPALVCRWRMSNKKVPMLNRHIRVLSERLVQGEPLTHNMLSWAKQHVEWSLAEGDYTAHDGVLMLVIDINGNAAIQLTEKNVVAEVFWRKDPKDIKKVYVNGNLICQDGHSVNLDDERIRKDFSECVREFWKGQPYQD